jgi:hypothetical protein
MSKVQIVTCENAPIVEPCAIFRGEMETRALLNRDSDPIHLHLHQLGPGASVQLDGDTTDVTIFVWKGGVEAHGSRLESGSSAIVEFGASLTLTACSEGASLLAFNLTTRRSDDRAGRHVHLLPNERVPRTASLGAYEGISGAIHADSQCPTCSVWMHENGYAIPNKETPVHSHSEDEVIFVTSGTIRLGRRMYGPGTALAIAANTKYGFFAGPDGLNFVNFRGSSPTYKSGDGSVVMDEAELWRSLLGRPVYLESVE